MAYITDAQIKTMLDGSSFLMRDQEADFSGQISLAEDWVNGYLEAAGWETPMSPPPTFVRLACLNYACYLIVLRPSSAGQFTDYIAHFLTEAKQLVDDFLAGKAAPPDTGGGQRDYSPVSSAIAVNPGMAAIGSWQGGEVAGAPETGYR